MLINFYLITFLILSPYLFAEKSKEYSDVNSSTIKPSSPLRIKLSALATLVITTGLFRIFAS